MSDDEQGLIDAIERATGRNGADTLAAALREQGITLLHHDPDKEDADV